MYDIEKRLEKLPFLPDKVVQLLNLRYNEKYDTRRLIILIEKDSLLSSRLLELANSKYFGFINQINTPSRAVSLYGMNFTVSVCICELVLNSIKFDLSSYNLNYNHFKKTIDLSFKLLLVFLEEDEANLREKLIIPLFCQYIGKFVISDFLKKESKVDKFTEIKKLTSVIKAERKSVGLSASEISSLILKKWDFPQTITDMVFYIDSPFYLDENVKEIAILNVINTICDLEDPFSFESIKKGIQKADEYDLNINQLKNAIEKVKSFQK